MKKYLLEFSLFYSAFRKMGRSYQHVPLLRYSEMQQLQKQLLSLVFDWESNDSIRPGSVTFKETYQKINKNVRRCCFICSKKKDHGNKLFGYKRVWSYNSYLETKLLEFEPRWIEFLSYIRFVAYFSNLKVND